MRVYKIFTPSNGATFRTAEREAKELAREYGMQGRVEALDVGTTKAELLPFLEDLAHREFQRGANAGAVEAREEREAPAPVNMASVAAALAKPAVPRRDANAIVDFLLDGATVAEAEAIFAAIGTRFAELVKESRR